MLELKGLKKTFNAGAPDQKVALNGVDLTVNDGDFITVIGGNGAGKSTLLNAIAGVWRIDEGKIVLDGEDITRLPEYRRAKFLGRVFQDPSKGTAADMQIDENLALAARRNKIRGLKWGVKAKEKEEYKNLLTQFELGLETRTGQKVGTLSGGQRQALTLLMASLSNPRLLLLDEHTAALDPKTATTVLSITDRIIKENSLTALMITHNMRDAIAYGNRLIMLNEGKILIDVSGEEKQSLTVEKLLEMFTLASGSQFANDRAIL